MELREIMIAGLRSTCGCFQSHRIGDKILLWVVGRKGTPLDVLTTFFERGNGRGFICLRFTPSSSIDLHNLM